MQNIDIAKTQSTLEVHFDAATGAMDLEGASYPENALDFFGPLCAWVQGRIGDPGKPLTLNARINYMNTSSSKCMLDLLELLEKHHGKGGAVKVNWYYEEDDEDSRDAGEELCEDLNLPYELLPY